MKQIISDLDRCCIPIQNVVFILHDVILLAKPFICVTSESTIVVEFIRNVIESNDLHSAISVTRWTVRAVMKKIWKVVESVLND